MSSPGALRIPRRALATLLVVSGGALLTTGLTTGCSGPSPVATSPEVARDPLAVLDPGLWDARSAAELRALPVQGEAAELSTWTDLGAEESALDPARDLLLTFLEAAYLAPAALRGLEDEEAFDHVSAATPEFWRDSLRTTWDDGSRSSYALTLAEPFRTVGRPALSAGWFRSETDEGPALALGTTIAWTALDTTTRAVGVLAYRIGILLDLDPDGTATGGSLRVTLHGLDGCAMSEQDGLLVPALAADEQHHAVQQATHEQILANPRIPLPELQDENSPLFAADEETYLRCD